MKLYKEFKRVALTNDILIDKSKDKLRDGKKKGKKYKNIDVNLIREGRKDVARQVAKALMIWRDAYRQFFRITKIKIDSIDIRMLKRILEQYKIDEFRNNVFIFFYEYRFDKWYREKNLVPKILGLVKNWNRIIVQSRKFQSRFGIYDSNGQLFEFLELQPLVEIKNKIPFGLDLPDELKKEGFQMNDIIMIDGRRIILMDYAGRKIECLGYCHFGYKYDVISNSLKLSNEAIILLDLHEINGIYQELWKDKELGLIDKRMEFECYLKKKLNN